MTHSQPSFSNVLVHTKDDHQATVFRGAGKADFRWRLDIEKLFLYDTDPVGKLHSDTDWLTRVQGNEHPPVRVHARGSAAVYIERPCREQWDSGACVQTAANLDHEPSRSDARQMDADKQPAAR